MLLWMINNIGIYITDDKISVTTSALPYPVMFL